MEDKFLRQREQHVGGCGRRSGWRRRDNGQEFLAGTSPAKLLLHIADISPNAASGSGVKLRWFAAPGKHYVLECSSDLAGTNWRVVADNLAGQGDIKEFIDTNRTHAAQFYRVRVKP
jgi:hypothetical protein